MINETLMFCTHFQDTESANKEIISERNSSNSYNHNVDQMPLSETSSKPLRSSIYSKEMKIPAVEAFNVWRQNLLYTIIKITFSINFQEILDDRLLFVKKLELNNF